VTRGTIPPKSRASHTPSRPNLPAPRKQQQTTPPQQQQHNNHNIYYYSLPGNMGEMDVKTMKVADLKEELKRRGLATDGLKAVLVERLQAHLDGEGNAEKVEEEVEYPETTNDDKGDDKINESSSVAIAADEEFDHGPPTSKRQRHDDNDNGDHHHIVEESNQQMIALYAPPLDDENDNNFMQSQNDNNIRTSSLAEPTMKLSGHKGSVYCLSYDLQGELLCSGSFDSTCLLWKGESLSFFYNGSITSLFLPCQYSYSHYF
jgi:hypothetical protein